MKKAFYLSLCALFLVFFGSLRAGATGALSTHSDIGFCGWSLDSLSINETGYTVGDSIIIEWGDGTTDISHPFAAVSGTGYYGAAHFYGAPGVYTHKLVLMSGGVRIDSVTYSYTWTQCEYMGVILYNDVNSDCVLDAGDTYPWYAPATVEIDSAGVPVDTVTATYWVGYEATGPVGTVYTFKVITNPHGFLPSCPTSGIRTITVTSAPYYVDTIGFTCDPTACLDNGVIANFCPGALYGWSNMVVTSTSCTATSATLDFDFDPKYTVAVVYGTTSYTVTGHVMSISIPSVSASAPVYIEVGFNPVGTLSIGDTVNNSWRLTPFTGDCDTTNNAVALQDTIRASYDPNHKSVQPNGDITAGTNLKYLITFENTGNAAAQNIHVMDTLSDNVDISSIRQIGSSANCKMSLMTYGGHNIIKFDFPGINLPDSSHHGQNTGFVEYTINARSSLAPGTKIDNTAGIYFDANAVIMTNNVENKIISGTTRVSKVNAGSMDVYPNPVNDVLTVVSGSNTYSSVTVSNIVGQVMMTQPVNSAVTKINVSALPAGVYYLTLKGDSGVNVQKFEKL